MSGAERGVAVDSAAVDEVAAGVSTRLQRHRREVEEAIFSEVLTMSAPAEVDLEYESVLRRAVAAGVGHGLAGIERGADSLGPIPAAILAEAGHAARRDIGLDVELRRYFAGYTILCDFVMDAAPEDGGRRDGLRGALNALAMIFDRVMPAVVGQYGREKGGRPMHANSLLRERVRKLLADEPLAADELPCQLEDWHVGAIGCGGGVEGALRQAAEVADRSLLLVHPDREVVWAWLGGRRRIETADITASLCIDAAGAAIALGEPARGADGWRLTHRQAEAAFAIAKRGIGGIIRYADVGLLASVSQDRLMMSSLHEIYLAPLTDVRDGGVALRQTLRAYLRASRNVSSAASALGVSRQTVGARLRKIEERLGRTIESCTAELEVALELDSIDAGTGPHPFQTA
jgi:PucR-like helix-turn-helix protein